MGEVGVLTLKSKIRMHVVVGETARSRLVKVSQ